MKRKLMAACLGMALVAAGAAAQINPYSVRVSKESSVEYYSSNYGIFGLDVERVRGGFIYPRGSNRNYMFGAGLWFGARKDAGGTLEKTTFITYNPNSGASWATPGERAEYPNPSKFYPQYNSLEFDHVTGETTLPIVPPLMPKWPLWREANPVSPWNPGVFEPVESKRLASGPYRGPAFMPGVHEQVVARFHDADVSRYERGASPGDSPIGLQMQQNIYSFNGGPFAATVIVQYDVINTSADTLYDCVLGQMTDADLGAAANDRARFYSQQPALRTGYVWTGPESNGEEYGALAITLLEAPVRGDGGFVDNARRLSFLTDGRVGTFPNWSIATDPLNETQRYDFMTSGRLDDDMGPGDRRVMMASTTFNMLPGDTAHFAIAYSVLRTVPSGRTKGSQVLSADPAGPELDETISRLMASYFVTGFESVSAVTMPSNPVISGAAALPNPASGSSTIRFHVAERANVRISVANSLGAVVRAVDAGSLASGTHDRLIDLEGLAAGAYLVRVDAGASSSATRLVLMR